MFNNLRHVFPDQFKHTVYHGSDREKLAAEFQNFDVIITTYETLRSEWGNKGPLYAKTWLRVVLDEGSWQSLPTNFSLKLLLLISLDSSSYSESQVPDL